VYLGQNLAQIGDELVDFRAFNNQRRQQPQRMGTDVPIR
jgi:hypothetical protein